MHFINCEKNTHVIDIFEDCSILTITILSCIYCIYAIIKRIKGFLRNYSSNIVPLFNLLLINDVKNEEWKGCMIYDNINYFPIIHYYYTTSCTP